jgi:Ca2+-binding EF-hand superfamily protein
LQIHHCGLYLKYRKKENLKTRTAGRIKMTVDIDGEHAQLKKFFDSFDINKNGVLEFSEFCKLVKALGMDISLEELQKGFSKIDSGNHDLITFEEFVAWWGEM